MGVLKPMSNFILNLFRALVRPILRILPSKTTVRILNGNLRGTRWLLDSHVLSCAFGSYERSIQNLINTFARGSTFSFDVGAHVGFHTLSLSKAVGPSGKVFAFEPNPQNLAKLRTHLHINMITNVEVFGIALSDISDISSFEFAAHSAEGRLGAGSYHVATFRLDDLSVLEGFQGRRLFFKVDVEGAEYKFLTGARGVLGRNDCIFLISMHGVEQLKQCLQLMSQHGYFPAWASKFKSVYEIDSLADVLFLRGAGVSECVV